MIVPLVTGLRMSCNCEFSDFYFLWGTGFEELGIAATFLDDNFDGEHDGIPLDLGYHIKTKPIGSNW